MAIRKNKKRIDPRYFLNETTYRDSLNSDDPIWRSYSFGTDQFHLHLALRRRDSERQEIWDAAVAGGKWSGFVKDLREFYAEYPHLLPDELDPGLK